MLEIAQRRWNTAAFWALLLAVAAWLTNLLFFVVPSLSRVLPALSVLVAVAALIVMATAVRRAIAQSLIYRGKVLSIILAVVTLALSGLAIASLFGFRKLPSSAEAPQIGQQVPDFALTDAEGRSVSLASLFAASPDDRPPAAPKAVLLIFYRGYW